MQHALSPSYGAFARDWFGAVSMHMAAVAAFGFFSRIGLSAFMGFARITYPEIVRCIGCRLLFSASVSVEIAVYDGLEADPYRNQITLNHISK